LRRLQKRLLLLVLLAAIALPTRAQAAARVQIPSAPQGRVSDYAGVLSAAERAAVETQLLRYEASARVSGTPEQRTEGGERLGAPQIAVVILPSLDGDSVEDVALRFAQGWKIGSNQDDGVLLLLALTEREIRIEVGYGAEGRMTDALSSRIIRQIITPYLRSGDYAGGLRVGVAAIHQGLSGQAVTGIDPLAGTAPAPGAARPRANARWWSWGGSLAMLLLLIVLAIGIGRRRGGGWSFLTGMLLGSIFGGRGGGGGGGGGGFSGGGGSFGGGGASGKY
jgi:uncharacterized protein